MKIEDLAENEIAVREWYKHDMTNEDLEMGESEDDVLVGSTTNLASSDKNQAETTEGTTPKANLEAENGEDPNYIEVLNMNWEKEEQK